MTTDNKYLIKVCALLKAPETPRSERAIRRPKKIKKPKLQKFRAIMHTYSTKPKTKY